MGRLIFTENGKTIIRTFVALQLYDARGRMHKLRQFDGTIVMITGNGPRILRFLRERNPANQAESAFSVLNLLMFAAGAALMNFWSVLWTTT